MIDKRDISIIIPAFNEGATIGEVIRKLKEAFPESPVIVVDDGSKDKTAETARNAGADKVIRHSRNAGYGASIKTGVRAAHTEYAATYDADGQHDPGQLQSLIDAWEEEDMIIGARTTGKQKKRRLFLKGILFGFCNVLAGRKIPDVNSGLRIFRRRDFLEYEYLFPDTFSLSTTSTLAFLKDPAKRVKFAPIEIQERKGGNSTVSFLRDGYQTFLLIVKLIVMFDPMRIFTPISLILFLMGFIYGVTWMALDKNLPDGAIFIMLSGAIIFTFGLLAQQMCSLRALLHKIFHKDDKHS
ncbi:glycosyltransferase family 2 protein [Candidatus Sumerlaeota bacterium]|nr:glycosyltransferase family 2 protein [Candidatus Sumerlaeota bacterium]